MSKRLALPLAECVLLDAGVASVAGLGRPLACAIENLMVLDVELAVIERFPAPVTNMWHHEPPNRADYATHKQSLYLSPERLKSRDIDGSLVRQRSCPEDIRLH